MKARNGIVMPILAIFIGVGMIVGAVAVIRLSNVVENNNTSELPVVVTVSGTTVVSGHQPYASGSVITGQVYDLQVSYTTTKALASASIIVEFSKSSINVTDVGMNWSQTTPLSWTSIVWTLNGDVLRGTLGIAGTQPQGATVNYYANLNYTVDGAFNFKVWVEGALG